MSTAIINEILPLRSTLFVSVLNDIAVEGVASGVERNTIDVTVRETQHYRTCYHLVIQSTTEWNEAQRRISWKGAETQ